MKRIKKTDCIIVPLPSKGECYPHKKGEIPIAYMTAMDENILADKKLREEGKAIDTLLEKKILDNDFKVDELYVEDRKAIVLSILKNNYGREQTDPTTGEKFQLDDIGYSESEERGNEKGLFTYKFKDDTIKYRYIRFADETEALKLMEGINEQNLLSVAKKSELWLLNEITAEINGNQDKDFIKSYIYEMNDEERVEYVMYLDSQMPKVKTDVDLDVILLNLISSIVAEQ